MFADGDRTVAVADTKYKLLDDEGKFPNADAYQLVTYCARLGLDVGHLIYAAGDPCPEPFDIIGTGTRPVIHSFDLRQPVVDLEAGARELFANVMSPFRQRRGRSGLSGGGICYSLLR